MGQLAQMDQLGDGVGQLVTRRVAARVPVIVAARVTVDGVDHLLEQMHHLLFQSNPADLLKEKDTEIEWIAGFVFY